MSNQRVKIKPTPWDIREEGYQKEHNLYFESNFTLANGYMGARGLLEEGFPEEIRSIAGAIFDGPCPVEMRSRISAAVISRFFAL